MSRNRVVCHCNAIDYVTIRRAQIEHGARTVAEIKEITGAGTTCGICVKEIEQILSSVCGCRRISYSTVFDAVKAGANSVDAVVEQTTAGSDCGRCKALIQSIIDNGK